MALCIKTDEADRLARELAQRTGESITAAVTIALQERLLRLRCASQGGYLPGIAALADDFRQQATVDRPADEIIGYDEVGLPT